MENFRTFYLLEALRIVQKASDRQKSTDKIHNKEIKDTEISFSTDIIGKVNGKTVKKTKHMSQVRDGETLPRDHGISNDEILEVIEKVLKKPTFKKNTKTMVTYKNKKGKYNLLVLTLEGNLISLITVIKGNYKSPYDYFTPKHKDALKIIIEKFQDSNINLNETFNVIML